MRGVGQQRRLPVIVRERVDLDELARRLLAVTAHLRESAPLDARARAEVEWVTATIDATVESTLPLGVEVKVLVWEMKRVLYAAEGTIETRMREQPRQIATHVAIRGALERVLRDSFLA